VVTPLQAQKLEAYREVQLRSQRRDTLWDRVREILATTGVFTLLVGGAIGGYLWRFRPDLAADSKKQLLLGVFLLSSALPASLITGTTRFEDVLSPVILAPLLATILLDAQVAIILAVVTVYSIALYSDGPALFALVALIVSLATIYAVNNIRRRASYFGSIIVVAGIGVITVLLVDQAYGVAFHRSFERLVSMGVSVVISFLIALFLLPAFERLFGLTTDLTLNEYADLNHPLLRQLAVRAPGSFHHSILVASLSEAAAAEVGANTLMTRVGAYFHDVGKMAKPEYFIENQMGSGNKHDQLSPSMSALVIQNHVKVGIEMAREHKLPQVIIDFIPEHHGTSVISFFYNKAVTSEKHGEVRMDDYRYPGPKPRRRETAIVMIADTVEAASRSLDDPTPLRLEQMVQRTIREKFANGQLDQSDLTLDDLRRIGQAFLPILIGAFHVRIKYPETDEETIKEMEKVQAKKARNGRDEGPEGSEGQAGPREVEGKAGPEERSRSRESKPEGAGRGQNRGGESKESKESDRAAGGGGSSEERR
jgi:putative nucleotidyltransferase with HDIG domain